MVHCCSTRFDYPWTLVPTSTWCVNIFTPTPAAVNWNRVGILLKAAWIPGQGCVIIETDSTILAATFIYSMVFDFVVLSLTAFKLLSPPTGRSRLVELIFNDGLIYFLIAWAWFNFTLETCSLGPPSFLANLIATVRIFWRFSFPHLIFNRYLCSWTSTLSCRLSQTSLLRLHLRFVSFNSQFPFAQPHLVDCCLPYCSTIE